MEYMDEYSGKLYHHKMKCIQLMQGPIAVKEMVNYLFKKHEKYIGDGKIHEDQIVDLVEKLKKKTYTTVIYFNSYLYFFRSKIHII